MDYVCAHASLGLCGLFRKSPFLGILLAQFCRFVCHVISGMIFFSAGKALEPALLFSLQYNALFLIPDVLIGLILFNGLITSGSRRLLKVHYSK